MANPAATVYWAVTAVPRTSVDTTCLQKPKTRLARILAAAQARRLRVVRLAPCRHIAVSVANPAATVYWAVTAVPRTSVDTTCLQKPKTRDARILTAAQARRLHVLRLVPCRHIAVSVANPAATVYWAVTAVPRASADTTCLQKPLRIVCVRRLFVPRALTLGGVGRRDLATCEEWARSHSSPGIKLWDRIPPEIHFPAAPAAPSSSQRVATRVGRPSPPPARIRRRRPRLPVLLPGSPRPLFFRLTVKKRRPPIKRWA